MQRGQSASLWQSEFEAVGFRARVVCSRINWDLRIGYFDVHPIGVGDVKFVTSSRFPRSLFTDPERRPALSGALAGSFIVNCGTMSKCLQAMKGLAEGRKTPRQAAEEPFRSSDGPSAGGLGAALAGGGALPAGVNELQAAVQGCGWRTEPPVHVSTSGASQTWLTKMPMDTARGKFDVHITVVDCMPNTIDVTVTCFFREAPGAVDVAVAASLIEFCARANYGTRVGHFDVSRAPGRQGQPVFTATMRFRAAPLQHLRALIAQLMKLCFSTMETYLPAVVAILRGASDVSRLVGACDAGVPLPVPGSMPPFGGDREEDRPAGVKEVVEALRLQGWVHSSCSSVAREGSVSIWQVVVPMTLDGDTRVEATVTVHDNMPNTIKVVIDTTLAGGAGKTTRREVVANLVEFAARANYALPEGAFQVSLPELARGNPAQVSFTVALVFRAAALQHLRHLVRRMLKVNFKTFARYSAPIKEVLRGADNVADLVSRAEGGEALRALLQALEAAGGGGGSGGGAAAAAPSGTPGRCSHHPHELAAITDTRRPRATCDVCHSGRHDCIYFCAACNWDICGVCYMNDTKNAPYRGSGGGPSAVSGGSPARPAGAGHEDAAERLLRQLLEAAHAGTPGAGAGVGRPGGGGTDSSAHSGLSDDEEAPSDMLTFSHLRIDKSDRSNFLGEGGFGEVWRGRYVATTVAVKMYKVASGSEKTKKMWRREIRTHKKLIHPHVVLILGATEDPSTGNFLMVTEFCSGGDLKKALQRRGSTFSTAKRFQLARQVAEGMAFLHSKDCLHLDLKSPNILLTDDDRVKIADFGLCRKLSMFQSALNSAEGFSIQYAAPELLKGEKFGRAADVYSFGIVMYEIFTCMEPYEDMEISSVAQLIRKVVDGVRPTMPTDGRVAPAVAVLINRCLHGDPTARPGFLEIVDQLEALARRLAPAP